MLDNQQGSTTIGRLKVAVNKYIIDGTTLTACALQPGELAKAIGEDHPDLTSITVTSGTLNEEDWAAIMANKGSLVTVDLAGATSTATSTGDNAFINCFALNSVTLPEGLETIGANAFYTCISLKSIDLPETLRTIKTNAFKSCGSLTSITLPRSPSSLPDT